MQYTYGGEASASDQNEADGSPTRNTVRKTYQRSTKTATRKRSGSPEVKIILERPTPTPPQVPVAITTYVGRVFCPTCASGSGYTEWEFEAELLEIVFEANEALHSLYRRREAAAFAATDDDVVVINATNTDQAFTEEEEAVEVEVSYAGKVAPEINEVEVLFST